MLLQLTIRDFALIEDLSLEFGEGFSVLTGETGAGKSILIDALSAALGERAEAEWVRTGAERAWVEAAFQVPESGPEGSPNGGDGEPEGRAGLAEWIEDGLVVLTREVSRGGKSQCRINGRLCTAGTLREVGARLVDIHGQHEHQSLLSPDRHVDVLDAWAGEVALEPRRRAHALFRQWQAARAELEAMRTDERERARQIDLYRFQIEEIDAAKLAAGEEEELIADRLRLANAEKLFAATGAARETLCEGSADGKPAAVDLLAAAARELESIAAVDGTLAPVLDGVQTALYAAQDAALELRNYQESVEFNPDRLEAVQARLEQLRGLKRKYGESVKEILAYREQVASSLYALEHSQERVSDLEATIARHQEALDAAAAELNSARHAAAERFEEALVGELQDLNMARTVFRVDLESPRPAAEAGERGLVGMAGRLEFVISPNPGEPVKPLAKIASGGELSRVMLAMKSATARRGAEEVGATVEPVSTLIFDEIDVGVGGSAAHVLGEKMAALAATHQVLCVTHLPQIAGLAAAHYSVEKHVVGDRTRVEVRRLGADERIQELARMLGGSPATAEQHARELLHGAVPLVATGRAP
jgi:DNA repair protein RecN (Recombination protein N)